MQRAFQICLYKYFVMFETCLKVELKKCNTDDFHTSLRATEPIQPNLFLKHVSDPIGSEMESTCIIWLSIHKRMKKSIFLMKMFA